MRAQIKRKRRYDTLDDAEGCGSADGSIKNEILTTEIQAAKTRKGDEPMMTNPITFGQVRAALRRRGALALCMGLLTVGLSLSGTAKAAHYITIDAPAASPG